MNKTPNKIAKPKQGDVVKLMLDDGRYAAGILARVEWAKPRKPYGIYVYFYGPFYSCPKGELATSFFKAMRPIARYNTSALDIYSGEWQVVGFIGDWSTDDWEFPDFYEREYGTGKFKKLRLDEADLAYVLGYEDVDDVSGLEPNVSHGSESARKKVSQITTGLPSIDYMQ